MVFHRRSCTIVLNIIMELKPVFKNRRNNIIQCFTNEKFCHILIIVLPLNFGIYFSEKKDLNESFEAEMIIF